MIRYHDVNKRKPSKITDKERIYIRETLNKAVRKWDWIGTRGFQDENQRKVVRNVITNLQDQLDDRRVSFKTLLIFNSICGDFINNKFDQSKYVDLKSIKQFSNRKIDDMIVDTAKEILKNS